MKRQITKWEVFTEHITEKALCVEYIKTPNTQ